MGCPLTGITRRNHKILLREAHLPDFEFGVQSEFHFRLIDTVIGLHGQLECIVVVFQHSEVKIAERGIGDTAFTISLFIARLGRNGDGVAVLVDQREFVLDRIGRIGIISGADEIEEPLTDDITISITISDISNLCDRSHFHHVDFKRQRRRFAVDCQRNRVFAVLIERRINISDDRSGIAGNLRDLARSIESQRPWSSFPDIGGNGNRGGPGTDEFRSDAEIADRTGQREVEQSTLSLVAGGIIGFRLKGVRSVTKNHRIENMVEFRHFGDGSSNGSVKKQVDFGNTDI